MAQLDITVPVLVDGLENETADAYRAWPQRVYVIDRDGTIVYKDVAPGNTDLSALESALRDLSDAER
jgi:ClpP class serine protease